MLHMSISRGGMEGWSHAISGMLGRNSCYGHLKFKLTNCLVVGTVRVLESASGATWKKNEV